MCIMINIILILSIAVNVLLTAIVLLFIFRIKNLEDKYYSFIAKFDGNRSIEEVMNSYMKMVKNVNEDNKIIKAFSSNTQKSALSLHYARHRAPSCFIREFDQGEANYFSSIG